MEFENNVCCSMFTLQYKIVFKILVFDANLPSLKNGTAKLSFQGSSSEKVMGDEFRRKN